MCAFVLFFHVVKFRWWTDGIGVSVEEAKAMALAVWVRNLGYADTAAW